MQEMKYRELEQRAIPAGISDQIKKLEARAVIHQQIEQMKALTLSDEEFGLLESFRRFKLRMRKDGEVFTWQTRRPEGIQLVDETANILHPQEAGELSI
jgi:hypothetical protein